MKLRHRPVVSEVRTDRRHELVEPQQRGQHQRSVSEHLLRRILEPRRDQERPQSGEQRLLGRTRRTVGGAGAS